MAVRLASLRAEASLDATKYTTAARQVDDANKKMAGSQAAVGAGMQQTQVRATETARSFERYRASLDPAHRAQLSIESGTQRINAALTRGQIDTAKAAELTRNLELRYANLKATLGGLPEQLTRLGASMAAANQAAARQAFGGIGEAFVGLRRGIDGVNASFEQHRRAIDPVYAAQRRLIEGQAMWRDALARGAVSQTEFTRGLQLLNRDFAGAESGLSAMTASMGRFIGVAAGFAAVGVARNVFDTAVAFERVDSALLAATGSTAKAAAEFEFVRSQADRLGLDLQSTALDYARLAAAAKGTTFEGEQARNIFLAIAEAATVLKLPAEQASGALSAIQQIISKGTVSMEELRQQLGDRLPGALQIAARALGLTTSRLVELVSSGKVAAEDLIPKFADEMRDTFGNAVPKAADSAQAAVNRFNNAYKEMLLDVAKSGALDSAVDAMNGLRDAMKDPLLIQSMRDIGAGIRSIGEAIGLVLQPLRDLRSLLAQPLPSLFGMDGASVGQALDAGLQNAFPLWRLRQQATGDVSRGSYAAQSAAATAAQRQSSIDYLFGERRSSTANYSFRPPEFTAPAASSALGSGSGNGRSLAREREAAAKADERRQEALDEYLKGLEREVKFAKLSAEQREVEQEVLRATALIQNDRIKGEEKLSAEIEAQVRSRVSARQLVEAQIAADKELAEQQQKSQEDILRRQQEFNDEVLGETADIISGIWEGGKDGIDDTLQYWKRRIIAWLSEMAAKLVLQPIIAPILQSVGLGAGALGSSTGGIGANFGAVGVGGIGNVGGITTVLGEIGKAVTGVGSSVGAVGSKMADLTNGLTGAGGGLSGAVGGGLGGIGVGATVATLTGGNTLGGSVGGLIGGALGSFLGPIGSLVGGAIGGFLGGLLGPKPSNNTAYVDIDAQGNPSFKSVKGTAETEGAIRTAFAQLEGGIAALEAAGLDLQYRVTHLSIGSQRPSAVGFSDSSLDFYTGTIGDPNDLAFQAVLKLAKTANSSNPYTSQVLSGNSFASLEDLTKALQFTQDVYTQIADAKPGLSATEQAMKDLGEGLKAARREAERYGLSVDKLDIGARTLFDRDIGDQIRAITDPVGLALDEFERGAIARIDMAKKLGADLVNVEKLNALERSRVLAQVQEQSVAGLRSLIDDLNFGNLSGGVTSSDQYFSALTAYNTAKRGALDLRTPEAIGDFENYSRSLIPIAQQFLGVSASFGDLRNDILSTARTLGTPTTDPSTAAIVTATTQGTAQIVDAVQQGNHETKELRDEVKRMNAFIQALMAKFAAAA